MSAIAEIYYFEFKKDDNQIYLDQIGSDKKTIQQRMKENVIKDNFNPFTFNQQTVDIISCDDNYLFGVIARSSSLVNNYLQRIKNTTGQIVNPEGLHIEDLRFFCIDLNTFYIALIKNYRVEHFKRVLIAFMNSFSEFENCVLDCIPIIDEDIVLKASKFTKVASLDVKIKEDSNFIPNTLTLKEEFGISQESIKEASIKVKLSLNSPTPKVIDILKNKIKLATNFEKFSITGTDENGEEAYLEFVNSFLTKKLPINLNDEEFMNNDNYFDEIKKELISSLR